MLGRQENYCCVALSLQSTSIKSAPVSVSDCRFLRDGGVDRGFRAFLPAAAGTLRSVGVGAADLSGLVGAALREYPHYEKKFAEAKSPTASRLLGYRSLDSISNVAARRR